MDTSQFTTYDPHDYDFDFRDPTAASTPIGPLLLVVFESILEVFILCLAGYILAGRGILDKKTQKQLNRLNVSLFTPALLFSKVAFFLNPDKLRELWIIPIFFVVVTITSMSVAAFLGWTFRLRRSQRSFAMAAAMFMNSQSLPIALMQSLVVMVPGLAWDNWDGKDAMLGRALTYLVMYSTLGMVLRWSYGVHLLSQADTEAEVADALAEAEEEPLTNGDLNEHTPLLGAYSDDFEEYHDSQPTASTVISEEHGAGDASDILTKAATNVISQQPSPHNLRPPLPMRRRTTFYNSFPNSPNQSRVNLAAYDSTNPSSNNDSPHLSDDDDSINAAGAGAGGDADEVLPLQPGSALPVHHHRHIHIRRPHKAFRLLRKWWAALNDFMTAPLWTALLALIVACIAPLQHTLENHAVPIKGAVENAGRCCIPLTLIVLGAYFYQEKPKDEEGEEAYASTRTKVGGLWRSIVDTALCRGRSSKHRGMAARKEADTRAGETKTVVIAVVSRMIITPILLMPAMFISAKFDFIPVFDDPVFVLANALLVASPPALTLAQITQAASGDAFERLISRTIFWSYCILTPITTIIFVVIGLMLAKI